MERHLLSPNSGRLEMYPMWTGGETEALSQLKAACVWQFGLTAPSLCPDPMDNLRAFSMARFTLTSPRHGLSSKVTFSSSPFGSCTFPWLQTLLAGSSALLCVQYLAFPTLQICFLMPFGKFLSVTTLLTGCLSTTIPLCANTP